MTSDVLPDECDFCGQILEEDEELHPLWVGEQPDPKPVFARATAKKERRAMGQVIALMDALEGSDAIQVDYKDAVQEVRAFGSETPDALVETSSPADDKLQRLTAEENHDKVGVEIRVKPEVERPDPHMEVCEFCKESFEDEW